MPNDTYLGSSRRDVSTRQPRPWHRHYSNCGDIEHGKSAQGGVIIRRRVLQLACFVAGIVYDSILYTHDFQGEQ